MFTIIFFFLVVFWKKNTKNNETRQINNFKEKKTEKKMNSYKIYAKF